MRLFEELDEETFTIFAAKNYYNPVCIDADEFHEDLKRFKYIRRLLNRYLDTGKLSERLLLNHMIVVFNVVDIGPGLKMLEYSLDDKHMAVVKPFLIFLKIIPNDKYTHIGMDEKVVDALRKI
jgi:hypothetical protein